MTVADLPEVIRIGDIVHPAYPETDAVFAERLMMFPEGCLIASGGYVIAHPIRAGQPPKLDTLLGKLPYDADALHLHDIALLPENRGLGLGREAVERLRQLAMRHHLTRLSLVSVYGTHKYWSRLGFAAVIPPPTGMGSYGAEAVYMEQPV